MFRTAFDGNLRTMQSGYAPTDAHLDLFNISAIHIKFHARSLTASVYAHHQEPQKSRRICIYERAAIPSFPHGQGFFFGT